MAQKTRRRGVLLTQAGLERWQTAIYSSETARDGQRCSLEDLAAQIRIAPKTVAKVMNRQLSVDQRTLDLCFAAFGLKLQPQDYRSSEPNPEPSSSPPRYDWGEMPDVQVFYGRQPELELLHRWISRSQPVPLRLLAIVGRGGMGKSTLAAKLIQQVQGQFEFLFWRSLRNAPPLKVILSDLVQMAVDRPAGQTAGQISSQISSQTPDDLDWAEIPRLIELFRQSRGLIVLDNVESLFEAGQTVGQYRQGYEGYGELFRLIIETAHSNCLILTSREKPLEIAAAEGLDYPVRCLELSGSPEAVAAICQSKQLKGDQAQFEALGAQYNYNPLAIKIVAALINDWFGGEIEQFLQQNTPMLSGIRMLLDQQFNRLSGLEQSLMYWLAIDRTGTTLAMLESDLVPVASRAEILEAMGSLRWRSLVEYQAASEGHYSQQPVVMDYICTRLVEQFCIEIQQFGGKSPALLTTHLLLKATATGSIQAIQQQLFLQPVAEQLLLIYGDKTQIEPQFRQILQALRQGFAGYAAGNLIDLCTQLQIDLTGYDFSGLPIWQADLRRNVMQNVDFRGANFAKVSLFTQNFGSILAVEFSPDGSQFATGGSRGSLLIWDAATMQICQKLTGHSNRIHAVSWSQDSRLASASADGTVRIWQLKTGSLLHQLVHPNLVRSVCWSPDGQSLVSGSDDGLIRCWESATGSLRQTLKGHRSGIWSVHFSPDGQQLASGSEDKTIRIWRSHTGSLIRTLKGHQNSIWSVRFSPDGQQLASAGDDKTIRIWKLNGKLEQVLTGHTSWIWSIAWDAAGTQIASAGEDQVIRIWSSSGRLLKQLTGHQSGIWSLSWSQQHLASGGEDQTVRLWQVESGELLQTAQGYAAGVWSVAWRKPDSGLVSSGQVSSSPVSSSLVASGSEDGAIRLWNAQTYQCLKTLRAHSSRVWSVAWRPGPELVLASASEAGEIRLWQPQTAQLLKQFSAHKARIWQVAWSPDGEILGSASQDKTLRLWDRQGNRLKLLKGHSAGVTCLQFSPDGCRMASGSEDCDLRLWDLETGQVRALKGHRDRVMDLQFSPDGQYLASVSFDQTLRLWQVQCESRSELESESKSEPVLQGHTNQLWAVAFSPDGAWLASAGQDQVIWIWEVASQTCSAQLSGHQGLITTLAWSPDGNYLISGSEDETIKIWTLANQHCETLTPAYPYAGMNIANAVGLTEIMIDNLIGLGAVQTLD